MGHAVSVLKQGRVEKADRVGVANLSFKNLTPAPDDQREPGVVVVAPIAHRLSYQCVRVGEWTDGTREHLGDPQREHGRRSVREVEVVVTSAEAAPERDLLGRSFVALAFGLSLRAERREVQVPGRAEDERVFEVVGLQEDVRIVAALYRDSRVEHEAPNFEARPLRGGPVLEKLLRLGHSR